MSCSLISWLALAVSIALGGGCNTPSCGPGTKRVQDKNGDLQCVAADAVAPFNCLADGGAHLVAGNCVSQLSCGPGTTPRTQPDGTVACVPAGGGATSCVPACDTPKPGTICVNGQVRHLVDNSNLATGEMVHVAVYEPLSFLNDPSTAPLAEADTDCGYKFDGVPTPASMLVVVAVSDAGLRGLTTVTSQLTGTGAQVVAQQSYQIDGYTVPKSVVSGWGAAGLDYDAQGAVVLEFFADKKPPPTQLTATDKLPVADVTATADSSPASARYFAAGGSLAAIDATLTNTSATGAAIFPAPASKIATYSGSGGTSMGLPLGWEMLPGGSAAHVVFVERVHPMSSVK